MKMAMIDKTTELLLTPQHTRESIAFTRYADQTMSEDKREKEIL